LYIVLIQLFCCQNK